MENFLNESGVFLVLPLNYRLGIYFNGSFICLLQDLLYLFRWCFFFLMILLFFELERTFCKTCDCLWMNVLLWTRVMSVVYVIYSRIPCMLSLSFPFLKATRLKTLQIIQQFLVLKTATFDVTLRFLLVKRGLGWRSLSLVVVLLQDFFRSFAVP